MRNLVMCLMLFQLAGRIATAQTQTWTLENLNLVQGQSEIHSDNAIGTLTGTFTWNRGAAPGLHQLVSWSITLANAPSPFIDGTYTPANSTDGYSSDQTYETSIAIIAPNGTGEQLISFGLIPILAKARGTALINGAGVSVNSFYGAPPYDILVGVNGDGPRAIRSQSRSPQIIGPSDGASPQSQFVSLSGTGTAGHGLDVLANGLPIGGGHVSVDSEGNWEVLAYVRRILVSGRSLDQIEIACASSRYAALVWEKALRYEWPVSISCGVPATMTRPGRAVLALCAWIESDFTAGILRRLLESGTARSHRNSASNRPSRPASRQVRSRLGSRNL